MEKNNNKNGKNNKGQKENKQHKRRGSGYHKDTWLHIQLQKIHKGTIENKKRQESWEGEMNQLWDL